MSTETSARSSSSTIAPAPGLTIEHHLYAAKAKPDRYTLTIAAPFAFDRARPLSQFRLRPDQRFRAGHFAGHFPHRAGHPSVAAGKIAAKSHRLRRARDRASSTMAPAAERHDLSISPPNCSRPSPRSTSSTSVQGQRARQHGPARGPAADDVSRPAFDAAVHHDQSVRALGVTSPQRSAIAPNCQRSTIRPARFQSQRLVWRHGAGGHTKAIIEQVNAALLRNLNAPGMKQRLANQGMVAVGSTPRRTCRRRPRRIASVVPGH